MTDGNRGAQPSFWLNRSIRGIVGSNVFRFLLIGGLSFLVDIGTLYFLYRVVGVALWVSTVVAFILSFFFNFFLQRSFAFGSSMRMSSSMWRYVLLVGFNTVATVLIVTGLEVWIGWLPAKILAVVMSTIWNFFFYRYLVFPPSKQTKNDRLRRMSRNV